VTTVPLVSRGINLYSSYRENKAALASLQHEKAIAAASRIKQYVRQISQQLAYAALLQLDAGDTEMRRVEFARHPRSPMSPGSMPRARNATRSRAWAWT